MKKPIVITTSLPANQPRTGEIPYKQWIMTRAKQEGVSNAAIYDRVANGLLKPDLRHVNKRVIFVRP